MKAGDRLNALAARYVELAPEESIAFACRPARLPRIALYIGTLGLYEFWRGANFYVVTERRCAERAGLFSGTESSLPLFYIQDAAIRTFLWWGYVTVTTAGGEAGGLASRWLSREDAIQFRRRILERSHALQPIRT